MEKYKPVKQEKARELVMPGTWRVTDLDFTVSHHFDDAFLRKTMLLEFPGNYSYSEIKNAIDRLYGLGGFEKIYFTLIDNETGKTLNLNIVTVKEVALGIGFKANTTDAAALLLNVSRKDYKNIFSLLSLSTKLSLNPGIRMIAESSKRNFPAVGIELRSKYQNYYIFDN